MSTAARRYYLRGRIALGRGETEQALEALASAIDLAPQFTDARLAYAVGLCRLGDTPRAAQTLRAGIGHARSAAARAALWGQLGEVLTSAGDFPAAEDAFQQAAAAHPAHAARAAAGRARVLAKSGRHREAVGELLRAARGG
jgi:tetratricopeptide (TPR) repeat protein